MLKYRFLVIWYNKNINKFYVKLYKFSHCHFYIGFKNQYNHEVMYLLDFFTIYNKPVPLRKRIKKHLINFLEDRL